MEWHSKGDILIRGDVDDRRVVAKAKSKGQVLANKLGRTVQIDFMNRYGSGRGKGFRAPLTQVHPSTTNPGNSIRAQLRRLPSGEIQLKMPLSAKNVKAQVQAIRKALGRRVKSAIVIPSHKDARRRKR